MQFILALICIFYREVASASSCHLITLRMVAVPPANCSTSADALEVAAAADGGTDAISTDAAADVTTTPDTAHCSLN